MSPGLGEPGTWCGPPCLRRRNSAFAAPPEVSLYTGTGRTSNPGRRASDRAAERSIPAEQEQHEHEADGDSGQPVPPEPEERRRPSQLDVPREQGLAKERARLGHASQRIDD